LEIYTENVRVEIPAGSLKETDEDPFFPDRADERKAEAENSGKLP
jgi:hypothetical protein